MEGGTWTGGFQLSAGSHPLKNVACAYVSINSKCKHPPRQTPGEVFDVVKSPALGKNFPAKVRPLRQKKHPHSRSILEDLVSLSC